MTGDTVAGDRLSGWRAGLVWLIVAVELAYVALSIVVAPDTIAMPTFARVIFTLEVASLGIVGALIATRQPRNIIGWILWATALAIALSIVGQDYTTASLAIQAGPLPGTTAVAWLTSLVFLPTLIVILIFVPLLFPDGHLLTRRWRRVAGLGVVSVLVAIVPSALMPGHIGTDPRLVNPVGIEGLAAFKDALAAANLVMTAIVLPLAIASIVLRYRRGDRVMREQLKWLLGAMGLTGACVALALVPVQAVADLGWFATIVSVSLIPIAIGIAILRYRLYEIDRIISRTLGYAAVTLTLAIVFVGVVLGLTAVLDPVTSGNTVAVAASTLVVAALFQPLRRRIQHVIDRRFNRARYDAQRMAEAFARHLRDEVDLDAVRADLLHVIADSLQPTAIGTWMRDRSGGPS